MSLSFVAAPVTGAELSITTADKRSIQELVRMAIAEPLQRKVVIERRRSKRYPYPYPIYMTPLAADGTPKESESFAVFGRHLSERGLDFYCERALPDRKLIASLKCGEQGWVGMLLELTWCRFTSYGWYENGGKFLRLQPSPVRPTELKLTPQL